jgi:hypothetical protein
LSGKEILLCNGIGSDVVALLMAERPHRSFYAGLTPGKCLLGGFHALFNKGGELEEGEMEEKVGEMEEGEMEEEVGKGVGEGEVRLEIQEYPTEGKMVTFCNKLTSWDTMGVMEVTVKERGVSEVTFDNLHVVARKERERLAT